MRVWQAFLHKFFFLVQKFLSSLRTQLDVQHLWSYDLTELYKFIIIIIIIIIIISVPEVARNSLKFPV